MSECLHVSCKFCAQIEENVQESAIGTQAQSWRERFYDVGLGASNGVVDADETGAAAANAAVAAAPRHRRVAAKRQRERARERQGKKTVRRGEGSGADNEEALWIWWLAIVSGARGRQ